MKKVGLLIVSFLLICIAAGIAGCTTTQSSTGSAGAEQAEVIRLAGGDYGYPQPFTIYPRGPGSSKVRMVFDSLIEKDEEGLIPWLAESWDISPDGKEYTFHLREGIKWHDGIPFTADDVKFTHDYELKHVPIAGGIEAGIIDHVQVIDDYTVRFVLEQPAATFLYKMYGFMIVPEHIYSTVSDPEGFIAPEAVTGTGPYRLAEYNKEHGSYQFIANTEYWGPKPTIQVVEFIPISDELISFEQGEIDFTGVTPDTLDRVRSNPDVRIVQQPAFWGYEFYFNMKKRPELGDKKIRQAFAYAIDRNELVSKVQRGAGIPGNMGILPDDHIWYNPDQPAYAFDAAKAKALLDEAGWKDTDGDGIRDKDGRKLSYTLSLASGEVRIGELIKARLKDVGIDIQVKALESRSRDANLKSGDYELLISGFGGWGQDADYLRTRYSDAVTGSTSGVASAAAVYGYHNETLNTLAAREVVELDDGKRKEIVFDMQKILAEDVPTIPLYYTTSYDAWYISKYDDWMNMFDHHARTHSKLTYLERTGIAAQR